MTYFTRDLLLGLAAELVTAGIGTTTLPVSNPSTGIYMKALPTAPDRAVALTVYSSVDQPKVALSTVRVQFFLRGKADDSADVDDLGDAIFLALQGLEDRTYGTAHLVQCNRISSVQLGIDDNKRANRSDNYEIDLDVPVTAGRPF